MDPSLLDLVQRALAIAGPPAWSPPDAPDEVDRMEWIEGEDEAPGTWVLIMGGDEEDAEDLELAPDMASELIAGHLRRWLADRGWQVQLSMRQGKGLWRLADILSIAEGGGDRLDADYPCGPTECVVLCESVLAVAHHAIPPLPVPPS